MQHISYGRSFDKFKKICLKQAIFKADQHSKMMLNAWHGAIIFVTLNGVINCFALTAKVTISTMLT